jgi:predicted PurR-regulated permease PerM
MIRKYPFYLKCTVILFGLVLFVYSIFTIKAVLVPLSFGLMLAILLNPLVNRLQKWKLPRILAISIALLIAIVLLAAMGYFLSTQIASFSDQLPIFKKKCLELLQKLQQEISHRFNLNMRKQNELIDEAEAGMKPMVGQTLITVAGGLEMLIIIPLFSFLFLFYKTLILNFIYEIFAKENSKEVGIVLNQTKGSVQNYMLGLLLEALIVATLNSIALLILGVEYAILLGFLGALLNILPFIGGIISVLLPLIIATITKDGFGTQLGIIIAYVVIQFFDDHFLVPYVVSSKVKINALISIIVVLLGGAVWGIAGMFLSIPFIGVLKIVFDRIPELKPWGKLLGNAVPVRHQGQIWNLRKKGISNNKSV